MKVKTAWILGLALLVGLSFGSKAQAGDGLRRHVRKDLLQAVRRRSNSPQNFLQAACPTLFTIKPAKEFFTKSSDTGKLRL